LGDCGHIHSNLFHYLLMSFFSPVLFQDRKFRLVKDSDNWGMRLEYKPPYKKILFDDQACEAYFGLTSNESDYLFISQIPKTPKQWAKRCQRFLERTKNA